MAKFKIGDVEDMARTILLDTEDDAYRFVPKEIYQALWDGLKHINNVRPESRYVNGLLVDLGFVLPAAYDSATVTAYRGTDVNMEDRWREAAVYYVVHRMYLKDDADTQNAALAKQYLDMFNASVMS